jgi:hypothetical protein
MFCSIVVLNKDLTSQLLVKHMGASTKAADEVVEALREAVDHDMKPENGIISSKSNNEHGIFIEVNDVVLVGITQEEVRYDHIQGQPGSRLSAAIHHTRPYQGRDRRCQVYAYQGEDHHAHHRRLINDTQILDLMMDGGYVLIDSRQALAAIGHTHLLEKTDNVKIGKTEISIKAQYAHIDKYVDTIGVG